MSIYRHPDMEKAKRLAKVMLWREGKDDSPICSEIIRRWPHLPSGDVSMMVFGLSFEDPDPEFLPPPKMAAEDIKEALQDVLPKTPVFRTPDPIEITRQAEPADIPLEFLPRPIADVAKDIHRRLSLPVGYFAGPALLAASALIQIRVKVADGFHVPPNMWCVLSAPSGSMKSAPAGLAVRPLQLLEENWAIEHEQAMIEYEKQAIMWASESKRLKKIVDEGGSEASEAAERLSTGEPEAPVRRRILISDCTPEKAAMLLIDNPGGLLAWTDELALRLDSGAKKGREDQHALDLAAFEASGPFSVDRVGRGSIVVKSPRLAIGGTIQPAVLATFIEKSRLDGWFERPIYLQYDTLPEYDESDLPRDSGAESLYFKSVMRLADLNPEDAGAQLHENGNFWFLPFDEQGKALYRQWVIFVEKAIRLPCWQDRSRVASWLGKTRSLVPKLALVIHLLEGGHGAIRSRALERAIGLALVFFQHASFVLGQEVQQQKPPSVLLLELLHKDKLQTFTARDIKQRERAGLGYDYVDAAIKQLLDNGWITECDPDHTKGKGRPTVTYTTNPALFDDGGILRVLKVSFSKTHDENLDGLITGVIEKTHINQDMDKVYINRKIPLYIDTSKPSKIKPNVVLEKLTFKTLKIPQGTNNSTGGSTHPSSWDEVEG